MSVGHLTDQHSPDAGPIPQAELRQLQQFWREPSFQQALARYQHIDASYYTPYLGGSDMSGHTVFFDKGFASNISRGQVLYADRPYDPSKYIFLHEAVEGVLIRIFGFDYPKAHRLATVAERVGVEDDGLNWHLHNLAMRPQINMTERESGQGTPPTLLVQPYEGTKLYRQIVRNEGINPGDDQGLSDEKARQEIGSLQQAGPIRAPDGIQSRGQFDRASHSGDQRGTQRERQAINVPGQVHIAGNGWPAGRTDHSQAPIGRGAGAGARIGGNPPAAPGGGGAYADGGQAHDRADGGGTGQAHKVSHLEAGYHAGHGPTGSHCGICAFFGGPDDCAKVVAPIRAGDGCKLYQAKGAKMLRHERGDMGGYHTGGTPSVVLHQCGHCGGYHSGGHPHLMSENTSEPQSGGYGMADIERQAAAARMLDRSHEHQRNRPGEYGSGGMGNETAPDVANFTRRPMGAGGSEAMRGGYEPNAWMPAGGAPGAEHGARKPVRGHFAPTKFPPTGLEGVDTSRLHPGEGPVSYHRQNQGATSRAEMSPEQRSAFDAVMHRGGSMPAGSRTEMGPSGWSRQDLENYAGGYHSGAGGPYHHDAHIQHTPFGRTATGPGGFRTGHGLGHLAPETRGTQQPGGYHRGGGARLDPENYTQPQSGGYDGGNGQLGMTHPSMKRPINVKAQHGGKRGAQKAAAKAGAQAGASIAPTVGGTASPFVGGGSNMASHALSIGGAAHMLKAGHIDKATHDRIVGNARNELSKGKNKRTDQIGGVGGYAHGVEGRMGTQNSGTTGVNMGVNKRHREPEPRRNPAFGSFSGGHQLQWA